MKKEKVVYDAKYCQEVRKNNERNLSFNYGNLEFMCENCFVGVLDTRARLVWIVEEQMWAG